MQEYLEEKKLSNVEKQFLIAANLMKAKHTG